MTQDFFLLSSDPPTDIVELENAEVRLGGTLDLKCSSMGGPRPDYSWIYYQMANVMEKTEDGVSHLIIKNATGLNMGSYTCHAGNQEGNVSKTVRVTVKGKIDVTYDLNLSLCNLRLSSHLWLFYPFIWDLWLKKIE